MLFYVLSHCGNRSEAICKVNVGYVTLQVFIVSLCFNWTTRTFSDLGYVKIYSVEMADRLASNTLSYCFIKSFFIRFKRPRYRRSSSCHTHKIFDQIFLDLRRFEYALKTWSIAQKCAGQKWNLWMQAQPQVDWKSVQMKSESHRHCRDRSRR